MQDAEVMRTSSDKELTGYPGMERCFEAQIVHGLQDLQNPNHAPTPYAVIETYRSGRIRSPRVLNQHWKQSSRCRHGRSWPKRSGCRSRHRPFYCGGNCLAGARTPSPGEVSKKGHDILQCCLSARPFSGSVRTPLEECVHKLFRAALHVQRAPNEAIALLKTRESFQETF